MKKGMLLVTLVGVLVIVCLSGCERLKKKEEASKETSFIEEDKSSEDPTVQERAKAVKAYEKYTYPDYTDTYRLVCLDEDDIPECFFGGAKGVTGWLTYHDGKVEECWTGDYADKIYYDEKQNVVCFYTGEKNDKLKFDVFNYYKLENDGTFENIGYASYRTGDKITTRYDTYPQRDTTEDIYGEYKSQFGELAESFDGYEEMYESVEDAYRVFRTQ